MLNKFGDLFNVNRQTKGPMVGGESVPVELKREAVKIVVSANIIEPTAFQLGAIQMANLMLKSEQQGHSRNWMFWFGDEDVEEVEKMLFETKNKVHGIHEVKPDSKIVRKQNQMYELFKAYGQRGGNLLTFTEHHLGHILSKEDIREILDWAEHSRLCMVAETVEYRELVKLGQKFLARNTLRFMYKKMYSNFLQSNLYKEKCSKIKFFHGANPHAADVATRTFEEALRIIFLNTFD